MSVKRKPAAELPGWPRYLSRELAAAYVGVSPSLFDQEVSQGRWPKAERRGAKGGRLTWDRIAIDRAIDQRSGIGAESSTWLERLHDVGQGAARQ